MKRASLLCALVAILMAASAGVMAEGEQTLTGQFVWSNRDTTGDLEAIFTPTGAGKWDVSFHFEFRGKPHVYSGTAEGNLSSGELKGKVLNEDKRRTFTFSGAFEEGKFSGRHAEIQDGSAQNTGTLTLAE